MTRLAARVTSSVVFVSRLERSVEFYRDVFSCQVTIHERDAALLLAPGGFQIYLIERGTNSPRTPRVGSGSSSSSGQSTATPNCGR